MNDDVRIENVRLDATQNDALMTLAKAGAAAFGYTAELTLDRQLAQLLRLRVSQINNCAYCLGVHHEAARTAAIPEAKIRTPHRLVGIPALQPTSNRPRCATPRR